MLCSCDGPPHPYDPSWCVNGPKPRPAGWHPGAAIEIHVHVDRSGGSQ